jgi:hypothetical protein
LKPALKIFHHESQQLWDENLLWIGLTFNTAVHENICMTPDLLFLGPEMKCPLGAVGFCPQSMTAKKIALITRFGQKLIATCK